METELDAVELEFTLQPVKLRLALPPILIDGEAVGLSAKTHELLAVWIRATALTFSTIGELINSAEKLKGIYFCNTT